MEKLIRTLNFEVQGNAFEIEIRKEVLKSKYRAVATNRRHTIFKTEIKAKSLGVYESEADCIANILPQLDELIKESEIAPWTPDGLTRYGEKQPIISKKATESIFKIENNYSNMTYAMKVRADDPLAYRISKLFKRGTGNIAIKDGIIKRVEIDGETEEELHEERMKWAYEVGLTSDRMRLFP